MLEYRLSALVVLPKIAQIVDGVVDGGIHS